MKSCAHCGGPFEPYREWQKYCSRFCGQTAWAKAHPERKRMAGKKWETKPGKAERKSLLARLRKYGLSQEWLQQQLIRQHHSCRGCLVPLTEETARIDHNHETGAVRGLLCDHCNWALGHARDNPMVLRRLSALLDHDPTKLNIYIIGALKNPRIPELGNTLRAQGWDVMDEWFTPGEFADTNWQAYEAQRGRTYEQALRGRAASNIYMFDRAYLDLADVVIAVMPAGKSAMLELGYAKGRGKRTILFLDGAEPERYDVMPGLVDSVVKEEAQLLKLLGA